MNRIRKIYPSELSTFGNENIGKYFLGKIVQNLLCYFSTVLHYQFYKIFHNHIFYYEPLYLLIVYSSASDDIELG